MAFRSSGLAPSVGCDYFSLSPNFFLAQPGIALSSPIEYGLAVLGVVVDLDRWRRPQAQESSFSSFRPCVACLLVFFERTCHLLARCDHCWKPNHSIGGWGSEFDSFFSPFKKIEKTSPAICLYFLEKKM